MNQKQGDQLIEAAKRIVITDNYMERLREYLSSKEKELEEKDRKFSYHEFLSRTYRI